jgi:hypothetical protein
MAALSERGIKSWKSADLLTLTSSRRCQLQQLGGGRYFFNSPAAPQPLLSPSRSARVEQPRHARADPTGPPSPSHSIFSISNPSPRMGEALHVTVALSDVFGNPHPSAELVVVELRGDGWGVEGVPVAPSAPTPSAFEFLIVPPASGVHRLAVTVGGVNIDGSPKALRVAEAGESHSNRWPLPPWLTMQKKQQTETSSSRCAPNAASSWMFALK